MHSTKRVKKIAIIPSLEKEIRLTHFENSYFNVQL